MRMSIIGFILDFFHARKYLAELLLIGVIAGAIYLGCHHLIQVGVGQERARWEAKLAAQQKAADIETARLQERATIAEKAHASELAELDAYRASHPLHGSLCQRPADGLPKAANSVTSNGDPSATPGNVQPVYPGDHRRDEDDPDQLGMLDLLARRGDAVSAQLREWQGR